MPLGVALVGVVTLVAGSIVALEMRVGAVPVTPIAVITTLARATSAHPPFQMLAELPELIPPAFEFAGIGPDHNVVASGTGEPDAEISLREDDAEVGRMRADAQGHWSFNGLTPVSPGGHELMLAERASDAPASRPETLGIEPAMLVVEADEPEVERLAALPEPSPMPIELGVPASPPVPQPAADLPSPPVTILLPRRIAVLHAKAVVLPHEALPARRIPLLIDTASYDVLGAPHLSGHAADGAPLVVIVDGRRVGRANANGSGRWSVALDQRVKAGHHHVRVEEIAASGQILAAVERPLVRD